MGVSPHPGISPGETGKGRNSSAYFVPGGGKLRDVTPADRLGILGISRQPGTNPHERIVGKPEKCPRKRAMQLKKCGTSRLRAMLAITSMASWCL